MRGVQEWGACNIFRQANSNSPIWGEWALVCRRSACRQQPDCMSTFPAVMGMPPPANANYVAKHTLLSKQQRLKWRTLCLLLLVMLLPRPGAKLMYPSMVLGLTETSKRSTLTSCISVKTGKVVDYHVASKCCTQCSTWEKKDPLHDTDAWKMWKKSLDDECSLNHIGSSRAMEGEGADTLVVLSGQARAVLHHIHWRWWKLGLPEEVKSKPYGKRAKENKDCSGYIKKWAQSYGRLFVTRSTSYLMARGSQVKKKADNLSHQCLPDLIRVSHLQQNWQCGQG